VTSRYEHAHLFAEVSRYVVLSIFIINNRTRQRSFPSIYSTQHGCNSPTRGREQECGKAGLGPQVEELTPLPDAFKPLNLTKEMDDQWMDLIKDI
jgi:hypothetical protein